MTSSSSSSASTRSLPTETPLPKRQLALVAMVGITEPIHMTLVFPFIYYMVRDFNVSDDPRYVGFYVGVLAAAFAVAQLATGLLWGIASDHFGRRPILLIGVAGSIVCPILFGLSKTFTWAVMIRILWGMLNGNASSVKTMVGELTDESNQAKGFSLLPFCWHTGSVIGPVLGGLLADPVEHYPSLFGQSVLFRTYPYLLPCLVCSALSLLAWVLNYLYLVETVEHHAPNSAAADDDEEQAIHDAHYDHHHHRVEESSHYRAHGSSSASTHTSYDLPDETTALLISTNAAIQASTAASANPISVGGPIPVPIDSNDANESGPASPRAGLSIALSGDPLRCTIGYAAVSFFTLFIEEMFPIWAATPFDNGGMGMSTRAIGIALSVSGLFVVYLQLYLYPKVQNAWGALRCFRHGTTLCAVVVPCFGILHYLEASPSSLTVVYTMLSEGDLRPITWVVLIALLTLKEWCSVMYFTSACILINNAVPDRRYLGTVNSVSYSAASLARAVGPALGGTVFSWSLTTGYPFPFNHNFIFVMTASISLATYFMSLTWNSRLDRRAISKTSSPQ
ncbi:hypothetical protein IWQ60_007842 [Tieghemiomyces parasiticus]|uniref:Major facilitator superfamily (MFS) profile domain-containing protein n=1 Tax=Tieghemiomyces parasiticus TaxID=78921 RepID=A0A9W7ZVW0_9FUNG|nr:hypothetical protein IWQ60_007842 [Tieghemiomyces parasiticus]